MLVAMRTVLVATELAAPADVVWSAVKVPQSFVHVAGAALRMPAAERKQGPWAVGDEVEGWTLLFGFVPLSKHCIRVESIDDEARTLISAESGGVVRSWDHEICVVDIDGGNCTYVDRVEIDAGPLTPVVHTLATLFYKYRQRRWRALAPLLAAAATGDFSRPYR